MSTPPKVKKIYRDYDFGIANRGINLPNPISAGDVANKAYVDVYNTTFFVASTTNTTTASVTDVVVTGMTLTMSNAGNFIVMFNCNSSNSANQAQNTFSVYVNGVLVVDTVRFTTMSPANAHMSFTLITKVTGVLAAQVVDIRWKTNNPTATVYNRSLNLIPVI